MRGEPTAEQLAALTAVIAARAAGGSGDEPAASAASLWGRPQLRAPLTPAPGAWRASALPHQE